jgi:hypothetical protein
MSSCIKDITAANLKSKGKTAAKRLSTGLKNRYSLKHKPDFFLAFQAAFEYKTFVFTLKSGRFRLKVETPLL